MLARSNARQWLSLVGAAALLSLAPPAFAQGKAPPAEEREEIEDKPDKEQPAVGLTVTATTDFSRTR